MSDELYRLETKLDKLLDAATAHAAHDEAQHATLNERLETIVKNQDDQETRIRKLEINMAKIIAWASIVAAGGAGLSNWILN